VSRPATEHLGRTVLDSGLRIVTERMPEARSVTLGVYAGIGSRDEADDLAGASHFLEHLLFKGTASRSAQQIARDVDARGGEMNAFTGRESTAYYTRLPGGELAFGLDLLGDVVAAPAFRPHEVDAEREVIVEELLMSEDDPDDVVHKAMYEAVFPDHPLGRETLGSMTSIQGLSRDGIAAFHAEHYRAPATVVAAAGDLDHDEVVARVAEAFAGLPVEGEPPARTAPSIGPEPLRALHRDVEQVHLQLAWRGLDAHDEDRHALYVGNHILGGGMASRLFQEVREERGLAYSVYSGPSLFVDCGVQAVVASTGSSRVDELLAVIDAVVEGVLAAPVTDDELAVAIGYLTGATLLSLEDSGSRMARLASSELVHGEVRPVDDQLARIRAVTAEDVQRVLRRVLDAPRVVAAVGPRADRNRALTDAAEWRR
jgi:predicted Zn-dependent peptidase